MNAQNSDENATETATTAAAQSLLDDVEKMAVQPQQPGTSQQMEEMISLLKSIAENRNVNTNSNNSNFNGSINSNSINNNITSTSTSTDNINTNSTHPSGIPAAVAYQPWKNISFRLPPLPVSCHPVRKWVNAHKTMATCLTVVAVLVVFSGMTNLSNGYSPSSSYSASKSSSYGSSSLMSNFALGGKKDKQFYFNVKDGEEDTLMELPKSRYPDGGSVICVLVSSNSKDINDLQVALRSLMFLMGDTNLLSPVLVFNEGDLTDDHIHAIRTSTRRPIAFPLVDLTSFPPGFDPEEWDQTTHFEVKDRKTWGYYQMIRFFVTGIWTHPAIERYETIMRIDSDSCFKAPNPYLPHMAHDNIVYHSQYVGVEPEAGRPFIEGLFDFAQEYMQRVGKSPGNMMLWHFIETTWNSQETLPLFRTNLEVSKKSFMTRDDVVKWHRALTEEEPFGLLRYRWGDAITRFLEAAIFATDETTLTIRQDGYFHKKDCSWPEVEVALKQHNLL